MNTTEFIRRYADAWNGHDSDGFLAVYTKEGYILQSQRILALAEKLLPHI